MPFIVAEGIDGSGKSTALAAISEELGKAGHEVLLLREPGSTAVGEQLRALLLDPRTGPLEAWTEACLFTAARVELVTKTIRPALLAKRTVLLDRYYYSTVAYQGYGSGLDPRRLEELSRTALSGLEPELVLVFDVPVTIAAARRGTSEDRIEAKGPTFQERVREGFLDLARRDPRRFRVIDATGSRAAVLDHARREVMSLLHGRA